LAEPEGIARDPKRNAWIANQAPNSNSVTEVQEHYDNQHPAELRALSPASGFSGVGMNRPYGIAVDQKGNVWGSNEGNDSLTVFIGAGQDL
jgi:DNA-binding beta-propeller fold protein YncE